MGALFAIASDAIASAGQVRYSSTSFTDFLDGGAVAGSETGSEASRWATDHFPIEFVPAGGALGGGAAYSPPHWIGLGGGKVGGAALYPLRIMGSSGGVGGGTAGGATENPPTGGGVAGGVSPLWKFWFGMHVTGGGGVVGGGAVVNFLLRSDVLLVCAVTPYSLDVSSAVTRLPIS